MHQNMSSNMNANDVDGDGEMSVYLLQRKFKKY